MRVCSKKLLFGGLPHYYSSEHFTTGLTATGSTKRSDWHALSD